VQTVQVLPCYVHAQVVALKDQRRGRHYAQIVQDAGYRRVTGQHTPSHLNPVDLTDPQLFRQLLVVRGIRQIAHDLHVVFGLDG